jgi:hypothetical protein
MRYRLCAANISVARTRTPPLSRGSKSFSQTFASGKSYDFLAIGAVFLGGFGMIYPNDPAAVSGSLILQYATRPHQKWDSTGLRVYPEGHWTRFIDPKTDRPLNEPRLQNLRLSVPYHRSMPLPAMLPINASGPDLSISSPRQSLAKSQGPKLYHPSPQTPRRMPHRNTS